MGNEVDERDDNDGSEEFNQILLDRIRVIANIASIDALRQYIIQFPILIEETTIDYISSHFDDFEGYIPPTKLQNIISFLGHCRKAGVENALLTLGNSPTPEISGVSEEELVNHMQEMFTVLKENLPESIINQINNTLETSEDPWADLNALLTRPDVYQILTNIYGKISNKVPITSSYLQSSGLDEKSRMELKIELAENYFDRRDGKEADNIEYAMQLLDETQMYFSKDDYPAKWSRIQNLKGLMFENRIYGDRGENIEEAIICYKNALSVRPKDESPHDWVIPKSNLGNAYRNRVRGNPIENQMTALQHYKEALEKLENPSEPSPELAQSLGRSYNNIANTLADLSESVNPEYLREAIFYYTKARLIFANPTQPLTDEWVAVSLNLGIALFDYVVRKGGDEQGKNIDFAIEVIASTLPVLQHPSYKKKRAEAFFQLARCYRRRIHGDKKDNINDAISCYEEALKTYTKKDYPFDWALIMQNMGILFSDLSDEGLEHLWDQTLGYYESSLEIFDNFQQYPMHYVKTWSGLANLYFLREDWQKASNAGEKVLKAIYELFLSGELHNSRQALLTNVRDVYAITSYSLAKQGLYENAIENLDNNRVKLFSEDFNIHRLVIEKISEEDKQAYLEKRKEIFELQREVQQNMKNWQDVKFQIDLITKKRKEIEAFYQRIPEHPFIFPKKVEHTDIEEASKKIPLGYFAITSKGTVVFVVDNGDIYPLWIKTFTSQTLHNLTYDSASKNQDGYFKAYSQWRFHKTQDAEEKWKTTLSLTCRSLWDKLIEPLYEHLNKHNVSEIALIP